MSMTSKIAAVGLSAALGAGVFAAVPVLAQEDAPSGSYAEAGPEQRQERRAAKQQALADALGIDLDTLRAAMKSARQQVAGDLGRPENREEAEARRDAMAPALAAELGISEDELRAAERAVLADGLSRRVEGGQVGQQQADEILAAFDDGTLPELRRERRLGGLEERLAQGVESGRLSQEQADEIQGAAENGTLRDVLRARRDAGDFGARPGAGDDDPQGD